MINIPAIAPIVRVLRLTCQEGAPYGPDTFETRLHGMNILARLCGTKYRLSGEVLRQGGLDAVTLVLENLKLPGSTATPKLLRKGVYDAMVPLFALAAAGHLESVKAALAGELTAESAVEQQRARERRCSSLAEAGVEEVELAQPRREAHCLL